MQIIPEYTNPLGVCTNCRAARRLDSRERIIDLGSQVELLSDGSELGLTFRIQDGDFQVCEACWTEGARLLGMITPDQALTLQTAIDHYKSAWAKAEARCDALLGAQEAARKVQEAFEDDEDV